MKRVSPAQFATANWAGDTLFIGYAVQPLLAVLGLLLVGFGQSPLVAIAFSLAAEAGPQQGARAVAIVPVFGYSVFLVSPLLIGVLATLFSLRIALLLTIVISLGNVFVAQRLPCKRV